MKGGRPHQKVMPEVGACATRAQRWAIRALREVKVSKIIITGFQYYYGTEKYGFLSFLVTLVKV